MTFGHFGCSRRSSLLILRLCVIWARKKYSICKTKCIVDVPRGHLTFLLHLLGHKPFLGTHKVNLQVFPAISSEFHMISLRFATVCDGFVIMFYNS